MLDMYSDLATFKREPLAFLLKRGTEATEPLVRLKLGPRPLYLLTDPNYVKPLLQMPEEAVDKGPATRKFRMITGENVVILNGEEHRRRRAAVHSVVARPIVDRLTGVLAKEARAAIADMANGQTFDATAFGAKIALRLLSAAAFGADVLSPAEKASVADTLDQVLADLGTMVFRTIPPAPWTWLAERRRIGRSRSKMQEIVRRVCERAPDSVANRAFRELQLSEGETSDELLTLLLVGHHTTGFAAAWLLHAIATVPGLADRLAAEAEAVRNENCEIDSGKAQVRSHEYGGGA